MSGPPTPRAAQLKAPALQVCESAFTSTVQALDAELTRECAAGLHARGCLRRRRGDEMIKDNHHLGWICNLQHLAPAFRQEGEIDQTRGLDIDDGDVA
jgi:hypothetical protein